MGGSILHQVLLKVFSRGDLHITLLLVGMIRPNGHARLCESARAKPETGEEGRKFKGVATSALRAAECVPSFSP